MADIQDLISQIPLGDLAQKLGVDESTAGEVVQKAVPALLGGMQANAASGGGSSLERAVSGHSGELLDGEVDLSQVDTEDGAKIVAHVFGGNKDQVAAALGKGGSGGLGETVGKALPLLAPIVMGYLSKGVSGHKKTASTKRSGASTDVLGSVLGALLGGNKAGSKSGDGLSDLLGSLGGLLGGGSK